MNEVSLKFGFTPFAFSFAGKFFLGLILGWGAAILSKGTLKEPELIQSLDTQTRLDDDQPDTYHLGSTVTLLPWLHKAIPTLWRIQQLGERKKKW